MSNFPWDSQEAFGLPKNTVTAFGAILCTIAWLVFIYTGKPYPESLEFFVFSMWGVHYARKVSKSVANAVTKDRNSIESKEAE